MPPGGVENRSEQLALRRRPPARARHRSPDRRAARRASRARTSSPTPPRRPRSTSARSAASTTGSCACPRTLVEDVARTTALAQKAWAAARGAADFARFRPWLERIVELKRAEAECVGYARRAVRRPARGLRARTPERGRRPAVRRAPARSWSRSPNGSPARAAPAGRGGPAPPLPARPPAPLRRGGRGAPWGSTSPAGGWISAVHPSCTGLGPGDCRITRALRRPRLRRRPVHHPPRGRPRAVRAGPRPRALRHAAGRGGVGRHGRGAGPVLGEPGGARAGGSGSTSIPGRASSSPRAWATCRSTSSTSR